MTTSDILREVTEHQIYCRYWISDFKLRKKYISPIRQERNASFNVYEKGGKLLFKDYGGESGDVWKFVQLITHTYSFKDVVDRIAQDFGLSKEKKEFTSSEKKNYWRSQIPFVDFIFRKQYEFVEKEFPNMGMQIDFWTKSGITHDILQEYDTRNLQSFTLITPEGNYKTEAVPFRPLYVYVCNEKEKIYKFYNPKALNKKSKFKTNRSPYDRLFGMDQITSFQDVIAFTAGEKDSLSLFANTKIRGVCTIAESTLPTQEQINWLEENCNFIVVLYDNDVPGVKATNKLIDIYPQVIPVRLSEISLVKDVSDYCEECIKYSKRNELYELIQNTIERHIIQSIAY